MGTLVNLTGKKIGRLNITGRSGRSKYGYVYWKAVCDCGKPYEALSRDLLQGHTRSCGCLKHDSTVARNFKHGSATRSSRIREYRIWAGAKNRCHNVNNECYSDYGERGIVMCSRWRESFADFLNDMGSAPSAKHSLDRIDNNGPYSPENCRWATQTQQANNARSNVRLEHNGEVRNLTEWARLLGMTPSGLAQRIRRGWNKERLFSPAMSHA